jgi:hypothetical protein
MRYHIALTGVLGLAALGCGGYSNNNNITGSSSAPLRYSATLTGDAERPNPVVTSASGSANLTVTSGTSSGYDPTPSGPTTVTYSITVSGLTGPATAAHIHGPADANTAAGILVPLTVSSTSASGVVVSGSFASTGNPSLSMDSVLVLLRNGMSYVDVHTAANQNGEIRGQIR